MRCRGGLVLWFAAAVVGQTPGATAAAPLEGVLDVPAALLALGDPDPDVRREAALTVRHRWRTLPPELFTGLSARPLAARTFLLELAVAPRPAATAWVESWGRTELGRTPDDRLLALAARGRPLTAVEAQLLLEALDGEPGDGFHAALAVVPPKVADALLGRLHRALATGLAVDRVGPLLDRLTAEGTKRLLGLAGTLPAAAAMSLCARIHARVPELVFDRVDEALDGRIPLEGLWLQYAAARLDQPQRIERVRALLADPGAALVNREAAFLALVDARWVDDVVLDFALASPATIERHLPRLLDRAIDAVPAARLLGLLTSEGEVATRSVQALPRRQRLEPDLQRQLSTLLRRVGVADGLFARPLAMALVAHGDAEALQACWPLFVASAGFEEFAEAMGRRREPFVRDRLLAQLEAQPVGGPSAAHETQLDAVALALVALGDRSPLPRLVARAASAAPSFLRRCAHHAPGLPADLAHQLLTQAGVGVQGEAHTGPAATATTIENGVLAVEMVAWAAAGTVDAGVLRRLRAGWQEPPTGPFGEELQQVSLRSLVASGERPALIAELREALAKGPLSFAQEMLAFELLGSMPCPPGDDDLPLAVELVLLRPRVEAATGRGPATEHGSPARHETFPMELAVAYQLRGADPDAVGAAFAAAGEEAMADPRPANLGPAPLTAFLQALVADRAVQAAVVEALAPLLLHNADAGLGPTACLFACRRAMAVADWPAAREYALAALPLITSSAQVAMVRAVLDDRDPALLADPFAALAAAPYVIDHRAAVARGDQIAAAEAARWVREFAGHDAATLANLTPTQSAEQSR